MPAKEERNDRVEGSSGRARRGCEAVDGFSSLQLRIMDINQLDIHGKLQSILRRSPIVAIPIDAIPRDLTEWARTLRKTVRIWVIEKFVSDSDSSRVLNSIPDETVPTISTEPSSESTCRGALHAAGRQPASHGERLGDVEDRKRRVSRRPLSTNSGATTTSGFSPSTRWCLTIHPSRPSRRPATAGRGTSRPCRAQNPTTNVFRPTSTRGG